VHDSGRSDQKVAKKIKVEKKSSSVMERSDTFLERLAKRFTDNGFEIKRKISVPPYQLDLIAVRSSWEITKFGKMARFILVTVMDKANIKNIQNFSSTSTKYALDNRDSLLPRGFGGSLLSIPVIVSEDFDMEVKKWMEKTLAKKHWAAFEFPVIISLKDRKLYYCKKTPIWGALYYKGFQKFVEEQFNF